MGTRTRHGGRRHRATNLAQPRHLNAGLPLADDKVARRARGIAEQVNHLLIVQLHDGHVQRHAARLPQHRHPLKRVRQEARHDALLLAALHHGATHGVGFAGPRLAIRLPPQFQYRALVRDAASACIARVLTMMVTLYPCMHCSSIGCTQSRYSSPWGAQQSNKWHCAASAGSCGSAPGPHAQGTRGQR